MKRTFAYLRVSTAGQAKKTDEKDAFGLDAQLAAVTTYCDKQGLQRPHEDDTHREAKSGALALEDRPVLLELFALAADAALHGAEVHVVAYQLDRLARDQITLEILVQHAKREGFRLHSSDPTESDLLAPAATDDEEPMRKLIRTVVAAVAELERHTIKRRLMGGKRVKSKRGGYTGSRPPLGYAVARHELHIEPMAAGVVLLILRLMAEGKPYPEISAQIYQQNASWRDHRGRARSWAPDLFARVRQTWKLYLLGEFKDSLGTISHRPDLQLPLEAEERQRLVAAFQAMTIPEPRKKLRKKAGPQRSLKQISADPQPKG